jgi:hypothetical protein
LRWLFGCGLMLCCILLLLVVCCLQFRAIFWCWPLCMATLIMGKRLRMSG